MRRTVALLLVSLLPASAAAQQKPIAFLPPMLDTEAINIGARRELFVDQTILGALSGSATRHLFYFEPATTQRSDVAMTWNADWEGSWTRYGTYIRDDDVIRAWYTACHTDGNHKNRSCYAVSRDGLTFAKPVLGLFEWEGSKQNNILFDQDSFIDALGQKVDQSHNFAPFVDTNPAALPEARYKGVGGLGENLGPNTGLYSFESADGIHWELKSKQRPILSNQYRFDSKNQAFWDPVSRRYALYFRNLRNSRGEVGIKAKDWRRDIMVSFSTNFVDWSEPQWLVYHRDDGQPGMNLDHLYTNEIKPYKRAPHIYLGFPARLISGSRVQPMFMASRDGVHFYRWLEHPMIPFTAPADREKNRSNHLWQEMVEIAGEPDRYSMYASENLGIKGHPDGSSPRLRRFTIRKDGFVSLRATGADGLVTTKPLIFSGKKLTVNYNAQVGDGGRLSVAILDEDMQPIPAFAAVNCDPLTGDAIDQVVTWEGKSDVRSLAGKKVYLQFHLREADLFAFKFWE